MKIGFLLPGQGAQVVGMGKELYENYEEAREVYDKVEKITGIDIKRISFEGPEEELNQTQNTQVSVLTECLAVLSILKKNDIQAEMLAGLSLGEYIALIEDGIFDFEDGIKLVQKRGEIMQNLTPQGNWKMAAILGLEAEKAQEACKQVEGFVVPTNFNTIGQTVISGEEEAVNQAGEIAKAWGAKKVSVLNTAGPFHTEKLSECSKALKEELSKIKINCKDSKVVRNIDGKLYRQTDDIVQTLADHIMNPVRFSEDLLTMYDSGIDTFVEILPRKTITGFVKRMNFERPVQIKSINNMETLEQVISELKEEKVNE
ncbi:MAG: ACP S-malonyltransferase [Clostridia bacterium]|nr:ACP S-malonyltransferase [Clostridia bacterium]